MNACGPMIEVSGEDPGRAEDAMAKGTVTTAEGTKYKLVEREQEPGLFPCPGEAHSNPFIDNCMMCAPRWGQIVRFKPVPLSAVTKGIAVPYNAANPHGQLRNPEFKEAEKAGKIKLVMVTEKTRASTSSFFAWVLS
jgi:hypothetical protein